MLQSFASQLHRRRYFFQNSSQYCLEPLQFLHHKNSSNSNPTRIGTSNYCIRTQVNTCKYSFQQRATGVSKKTWWIVAVWHSVSKKSGGKKCLKNKNKMLSLENIKNETNLAAQNSSKYWAIFCSRIFDLRFFHVELNIAAKTANFDESKCGPWISFFSKSSFLDRIQNK